MARAGNTLSTDDAGALDLDGWLSAFDNTPISAQAPRDLPWVAGGALVMALLIGFGVIGTGNIEARLPVAGALVAMSLVVMVVAIPAGFRLIVQIRNYTASNHARWLGHGARWALLVLVNGVGWVAYQRQVWSVAVVALVAQLLLLVEGYVHFITCRASLVDRVAVDSLLWMRKATYLLRAQVVASVAWLACLLWPPAVATSADDWTAIGVVVAITLPILAYSHHQLVAVEQWRRDMLCLLDEGLSSPDTGTSERSLVSALRRLETLVVAGPATIGPAVEPAIRRMVIALAVAIRRDQSHQDRWSASLSSEAARRLVRLAPYKRADLAYDLMDLLRARLLYGAKRGRA